MKKPEGNGGWISLKRVSSLAGNSRRVEIVELKPPAASDIQKHSLPCSCSLSLSYVPYLISLDNEHERYSDLSPLY